MCGVARLTSCNSFRNCCVSLTFVMICSAICLLRWKKCSNSSRTLLTRSVRISVLPSLFFVCDSNTGSFRRIATAPTMHSRTSSPSNLPPQYSFTALSKPSRNALKCVPPSLVYWPLTNE